MAIVNAYLRLERGENPVIDITDFSDGVQTLSVHGPVPGSSTSVDVIATPEQLRLIAVRILMALEEHSGKTVPEGAWQRPRTRVEQ